MSSGASLVTVPDVGQLDLDLALDVLQAAGLKQGVIDTVKSDEDFGTVVTIVPSAGTTVKPGRTVDVSVSSGPASVKVPDLTGMPLSMARDRLIALGLRVGSLEQRMEGKAGTVLTQAPAPGAMLTRGSAVNLTISGAME
jgi:serine/threonine-protein kinase